MLKHSLFNTVATLSRDKRDTLLLVFACFLVILNHFDSLYIWVSCSAIALMLWRAWLTLRGNQLPARWVLLPIAAALMAGIFWQFRSFFGRETGVAMLALLLTCKMLEMHAKRDLFVILFLSFFLLLTRFFESQSLVAAFQVAVSTIVLLLAQLSFQFEKKTIKLWAKTKIVLSMLAIAMPLTVLAFFLFPRIQGPLWGLPSDADVARSGLSDSMTPGNISKLAMSEELVFRVKFLEQAPEKSALYWRALVLTQFDGRRWSQNRFSKNITPRQLETRGPAISQEITLEPSNTSFLFGVDSIANPPLVEGTLASLNSDGELQHRDKVTQRIRYQVTSFPDYRFNVSPNPIELQLNLRLPNNFNPQTRNFAQEIRRQNPEPLAQVNAVLNFFRNERFFYTLEPPQLGRHSADDFLFNTRAGFCEHYSSAFVILMRAMGIPARVVTGYQGGTLNTQGGFYEIRQSDAHAWAEVWLSERGWIRVDPTAAVAPNRILRNLEATQEKSGLAGIVNDLIKENAWSRELRMQWNALNYSWNQWVLNYNQTQQTKLLDRLGLNQLDWSTSLMWIFGIGLIIVGSLAIPLLPKRIQRAPIDRLYLRLCEKLAKQGFVKTIHEGPSSYLERLQATMAAEKYQLVDEFIRHYIAIKYGKTSASVEQKNMDEVNAQLQDMRRLLKRI